MCHFLNELARYIFVINKIKINGHLNESQIKFAAIANSGGVHVDNPDISSDINIFATDLPQIWFSTTVPQPGVKVWCKPANHNDIESEIKHAIQLKADLNLSIIAVIDVPVPSIESTFHFCISFDNVVLTFQVESDLYAYITDTIVLEGI